MYAFRINKRTTGGKETFLKLPEEFSSKSYQTVPSMSEATTASTIGDLLCALQEYCHSKPCSQDLEIVRLISTPGTTTRREVPLGTPGSKVAIRGVADRLYVRHLDGVSGEKYGDINGARLFADIPAALEAMQEFMYGRKEYACSFATLVGVLESTTEPALTTEEVR